MIRFIDLRGQDTGFRFAFFDTITNQFVKLGPDQVWRDRADLLECRNGFNNKLVARMAGFLPEWANTPEVDTDD